MKGIELNEQYLKKGIIYVCFDLCSSEKIVTTNDFCDAILKSFKGSSRPYSHKKLMKKCKLIYTKDDGSDLIFRYSDLYEQAANTLVCDLIRSKTVQMKEQKWNIFAWIKENVYENLYRVYYRIYYYAIAIKVIENPRKVEVPMVYTACTAELDPQCRKHHNFLYAQVVPRKWTYWRRKFAFRIQGTSTWYELPKLTPWSYDKFTGTKFGLNYTFVEKYKGKKLEFATWL